MKIVHLCLYGPVMDGWNYQDNMLTKYHRKMGHEVTIVASKWVWNKNNQIERIDKNEYYNDDGVKVIRLDIRNNKNVLSKFKRYNGLETVLKELQPDILFVHNAAYLDIYKVVKYLRKNPGVKTYVDNHNDFSNSGRNMVSKYVLHKGIWKLMYKKIAPYTEKFYGVLPARVDFLINIYGTPKNKTELLVMGADDEEIERVEIKHTREEIRKRYGIKDDDFLIVTGGKIDAFKTQTLLLLEAINEINRQNIKVLLFGSISQDLKQKVMDMCNDNTIRYIGWIDAMQSYDYFSAADLVAFPGRHSVFWEQVAGMGIPMLCKYWDGTTHIDMGGNVLFLKDDSVSEVKQALYKIIDNPEVYQKMKICAQKCKEKFRYSDIARRAIEN